MFVTTLLVGRSVAALYSALAREVGVMYFLVVLVVLASMVWIAVVKVRPRRMLEWAIIAWAAAIVDVIVLGVSSADPDAVTAAAVLVTCFGLPGLIILGVIWFATRPRGRCASCGSDVAVAEPPGF